MKSELKTKLKNAGFQFMHTGGGCTAWFLENGDEHMLICDDASADLESPESFIGIYDRNGDEIRHNIVQTDQVVEAALSMWPDNKGG